MTVTGNPRGTVGVMARAPIPGRCKTRLSAGLGPEFAARLYGAMILDTLDAIAATCDGRLVVMAAPEDDGVASLRAFVPAAWEIVPQIGAGLGERLAGALVTLSADGSTVVLVSSDSPTAPWGAAGEALARLQGPRRALMGPCDDGGYWLIGVSSLELGILDGIAWSTPVVAEQTRARCAELGLALEELPTAYDVDEARDLERLRVDLRTRPERAPRTAAFLRLHESAP